ncbi:hypothetical protein [Myxococcus fulvus]|uniref:hypothetical protein n=1 Tax=Myxococcus fulvus TaxID=33 RepID=UPI0020BE980B|nr:hypothetical protein [Myxococcus fulvus]MCK8503095.1 hypothetical protein [Myxococcus fulvus]
MSWVNHGEDGLVREILQRARAGANQGRSTKSSEVSGCTHPLWRQTMNDHGLRGTASLTRGSVSTTALIECYERTVWQFNAAFTPGAALKPERSPLMVIIMVVCIRQASDHRHDIWRYLAIASSACALIQERDLYKACQLADCYSGSSSRQSGINFAIGIGSLIEAQPGQTAQDRLHHDG